MGEGAEAEARGFARPSRGALERGVLGLLRMRKLGCV